jgi:hypothetical protein
LADQRASRLQAQLIRRAEDQIGRYALGGIGLIGTVAYRKDLSGSVAARPVADRLECHARQQGFEVRLKWNF